MDKTAIKNFAIESRKILRESAIKKAGMYGITIDECSKPIQKGADFEVYKTIAGDEIRLYSKELKMRSNLVNVIKEKGFEQVIEETAYTWFNRLIAIRFMEVNDYLPTRVRVLSSETGSSTPDIVTHALDVDLNLSADEIDKIQAAKDDNRFDDAFQLLFIKQCNELNKILPGLFEATNDYMELLLDISYTSDGVVRKLVDEVPEDDFNVEKEGQVEIIGWLYQYYNTELKDDTFAKLKKNIKITKERIPAATQLFTPDWIVRYMVENSLGRVWIDHLRAVDESADEKKIAEDFGWKYYLPEAEQEADVTAELVKIRADRKDLKPQDITCIDPCCGSGHILVYMFDVLLQIYESEGISVRDAVFDILEKNIHGLDIDVRAYQLSYFALMMKGRGAAGRRFFRGVETEDGGNRPVTLNVYAIDESNDIDRSALSFLGKGMLEIEKNTAEAQINRLFDEMTDAKEYGSIINVTECDWELMDRYLNSISADGQLTLGYLTAYDSILHIRLILNIGRVLSQKYSAVVTNPPYMGSKSINSMLLRYIQNNYTNGKADIYGAFVEKCINSFTDRDGYIGFITPYVWLYLSSFTDFRVNLLLNSQILSLVQLEYNAFEVACVPVCTFAMRKSRLNYIGRYIQLAKFRGWENQEPHVLEAVKDFNLDYCYETNQSKFGLIPDTPIAYWISDNMYKAFENAEKITTVGMPRQGMATADNGRFMRIWYEVNYDSIDFNCASADRTEKKWYPHSKGGSLRRWYGNNIFIINWKNNGAEIKAFEKAVVRNPDYYLKKGISWSDLTISWFTARWVPSGFTFDSSGPTFFAYDESMLKYVCGYFNSWVFQEFLNISCQGMHYSNGVIANLPIIIGDDNRILEVEKLVSRNIEISKEDWDLAETSWDFEALAITKMGEELIENCIDKYISKHNEYEKELENNERQLDLIFAEIFGMSNEEPTKGLCPPTLRKIDTKTCVLELISYAVGCMFGRYSLEENGIICAGTEFNANNYGAFAADEDAIIPITDEVFFMDDIVGRFEEFVRLVYGEKTLEANLQFISDNLCTKGESSREKIRTYFLNDYFKDHCNMYSVTGSGKRPIYWLFDSGKQNGFKCLIYMHRYTPDTVGLIRSVYLKKAQDAIEASLKNAEYAIANTESAVDRATNTRKRDKYIKQLAEIKPYYQALSHVAMQRIDIDLDDGVKVNYAKFQGIEVGGEGEKKQRLDLLAKI